MIGHTNSGSVAFWRSDQTEIDNSYYKNTWQSLPEDTLAISRPTEDSAFSIIFLKTKGLWDDEQYLTF